MGLCLPVATLDPIGRRTHEQNLSVSSVDGRGGFWIGLFFPLFSTQGGPKYPQVIYMSTLYQVLAFSPGPMELVIVLMIGLLLFGKRLPDIARNLGRGVVEFKRGVKNIEDDIDYADQRAVSSAGAPTRAPIGGVARMNRTQTGRHDRPEQVD